MRRQACLAQADSRYAYAYTLFPLRMYRHVFLILAFPICVCPGKGPSACCSTLHVPAQSEYPCLRHNHSQVSCCMTSNMKLNPYSSERDRCAKRKLKSSYVHTGASPPVSYDVNQRKLQTACHEIYSHDMRASKHVSSWRRDQVAS
jgi:hypothetical protein